jgi:hypothetical protein
MDAPDAIPSDDARVVIPALLRGILRETAEENLRKACDLAFRPTVAMTWSKRCT